MADFDKAFKINEPFIKKWEGGLSGLTSDSASANPAPCGIDPKYNAPYHTNKGVTWATFKNSASKLGYEATCDNFLSMPDSIWKKLYKQQFWDVMKGDAINSDVIASFVTEVAWGSGAGSIGGKKGAYPFLQRFLSDRGYTTNSKDEVVAALNKEIAKNQKTLFNDLVQARRDNFISLNQPQFTKGWLNRLDDFKKTFDSAVSETVEFTKKNWIPIAITIVGLAGLGFYLIKSGKIKIK